MKEEVLKFLQSSHIATVATVTSDNKPHAAVVLYTVDDNFNIYFTTHSSSEKVANIEKNNAISFTAWEHQGLSVQIDGTAEEVTDTDTQNQVFDKLAQGEPQKSNLYPPILRINGEDYAVYKIKPTRCRYLDLTHEHIKEGTPPIQEVDL